MTRACVLLDEKEQIKISSSTLKKSLVRKILNLKILYYLN